MYKMKPNDGVVTRDIAEDAVLLTGSKLMGTLSQDQLDKAYDWAMREHLSASWQSD